MTSILIRNGTLVTMDDAKVINGGAIFVKNGHIDDIGPTAELAARYRPDQVIDATGKIVMPGLIDAHYHTSQQFLRGALAAITRKGQMHYPVWKNYLIPFESLLTAEDVYLSGLAAYTNMFRVGTTCISEHGGQHPDQLAKAMLATGIRGLLAESTMDIPDPDLPPSTIHTTEQCIDRNLQIVRKWSGSADNLIKGCFSLRQIIVCTPGLIKELCSLAEQHDALVQTHLAEGTYEVEYTINRYSMRPAEYMESLGALSSRLLCAHSGAPVRPRSAALRQVRRQDGPLPQRQLYRPVHGQVPADAGPGRGQEHRHRLRRRLRRQHRPLPGHERVPDRPDALLRHALPGQDHDQQPTRWWPWPPSTAPGPCAGTRPSAASRVGKQADIIILDPSSLDCQPLQDDVYYTIVKCLRGRDVETVLVNGRVVMEDRRLLTVDEEDMRRRMAVRVPQLFSELVGYYEKRRG